MTSSHPIHSQVAPGTKDSPRSNNIAGGTGNIGIALHQGLYGMTAQLTFPSNYSSRSNAKEPMRIGILYGFLHIPYEL